jgi:hypothetical protein
LSKEHSDARRRGQRHDRVILDLLPPTKRQETALQQPGLVLIESSPRARDLSVQLATSLVCISSIVGRD